MDFTKTIIPLALMASESYPIRPLASWAIDSEPIRARGIIVKYIVEEGEFLYKKAQKSSDALTTELIQALWRTLHHSHYTSHTGYV